DVVAKSAVERVVARIAADHIVAGVADDQVRTFAADGVFKIVQRRRVDLAGWEIAARPAAVDAHRHAIATILVAERVKVSPASDARVVAQSGIDTVRVTVAARERIVSVLSKERIISFVATEIVIAWAAEDVVGAVGPRDGVVARAGIDVD